MRWDNLFTGLESLWDAEDDNAESDERRELMRADRATRSFLAVLADRAISAPLCVTTEWSSSPIHVGRVGASWIEGMFCGSNLRVIVPLHAIVLARDAIDCSCRVEVARHYPHVTIGAVMRDCERRARMVRVVCSKSGVNGRIVGVWRDAIDVASAGSVSLLPLSVLDHIVIEWA